MKLREYFKDCSSIGLFTRCVIVIIMTCYSVGVVIMFNRASPPVISESNILPSADGYTVRALVIPLPNKSSARRLENLLIRTLKDNVGLDICNKANGDETHRLFSRG